MAIADTLAPAATMATPMAQPDTLALTDTLAPPGPVADTLASVADTAADTLDTLSAFHFYGWPEVPPRPTTFPSALDYIPLNTDTVAALRPSMFAGQQLRPSHRELIPLSADALPAWVFVALLMLMALAMVYYVSRKVSLLGLMKAAIDHRTLDRLVRDAGLSRPMLAVPMGLLFSATVGTSVWLAAGLHTGPLGWASVVVVLAAAYLLRNGLLRLLGAVFDNQAAIGIYINSNYIIHLVAATLVMPMLLLQAYLPGANLAVAAVAGGVLAVAFLVRLARGLKLFLTFAQGANLFLFYYLCIVEIVPILVFAKWIISE